MAPDILNCAAAPAWSRATLRTADFERAKALIHSIAGISLSESKIAMVEARLAKRLKATGCDDYGTYLDAVAVADSAERTAFVNALTTNLTAFFREPYHFPPLIEHLRARLESAQRPLTVWSAGCSTGQEPVSLAIALVEAFGSAPPVRIIASDIDTDALGFARRGVYPLEKLQGLSETQVRRFFLRGSGANEGLAIARAELRDMIEFRRINLADPQWGVGEDIAAIFCRNVMIYFSRAAQQAILRRFATLLAPDGLLFAGHSENLFYIASDLFQGEGNTIYRVRRGDPC